MSSRVLGLAALAAAGAALAHVDASTLIRERPPSDIPVVAEPKWRKRRKRSSNRYAKKLARHFAAAERMKRRAQFERDHPNAPRINVKGKP
jgi:hypothetical protein